MTIALLILGMGIGIVAGFCGWMIWDLGWLAEKRHALLVPRRSAIQSPPPVTVLDGVVIPRRKGIES